MQLTFKVHPCDAEGVPDLADAVQFVDNVTGGVPEVRNVFSDEESAKVALLERLRCNVGRFDGKEYKDFVIQPYNEAGQPVELVDKKDRVAAAKDANYLIQNNKEVRDTMAAMVAARQLYATAVTEANRLLSGTGGVDVPAEGMGKGMRRPPHPFTIEVLIQAAVIQTQQAFTQDTLLTGIAEMILPWLANRVKVLAEQDAKTEGDQAAAAEKQRRGLAVPLGFSVDHDGETVAHRQRPVILVGYGPAVKYLLDLGITAALSTRTDEHPDKVFTVVWFADKGRAMGHNHERLVKLPRGEWERCTRSKAQLSRTGKMIESQLPFMPDLLVVDDLQAAGEGIITPRSAKEGPNAVRISSAVGGFQEWCHFAGMLLLGGVPTINDAAPDLSGPSWESLRAIATIRPVGVIRQAPDLEAGKFRIQIGRDAFRVDVDAKLLVPQVGIEIATK